MILTHLQQFRFFAGLAESGAAVAPTVTVAGRPKRPARKRKFTFPNGITVWASDEQYARFVAQMEFDRPDPEPETVEPDPAPEPEATVIEFPAPQPRAP